MSADDTLPDDHTAEPPMPEDPVVPTSERPPPEEALRAAVQSLKPIVEALIFASPEPLSLKALFKLLDTEPREHVEAATAAVRDDYARPGGLQLVEVAGGYQIVTRPELHEWVRRLFHERTTQKLSVPALETLAVIAYRQPITAPEITDVRGVNTSGVLSTLIERKLVKIVGRKQVVGRPFMYATTKEFLDRFGLRDLNDLPKVEDMAELLGFDTLSGLEQDGSSATLPFESVGDEGEHSRAESSADAAVASPSETRGETTDATVAGNLDEPDPSSSVH
jgi:segregation and condensation protein B